MPTRRDDAVGAGVRQRDCLAAASGTLNIGERARQHSPHPPIGLDRYDLRDLTRQHPRQPGQCRGEVDSQLALRWQQPVDRGVRRARAQPVVVVGDRPKDIERSARLATPDTLTGGSWLPAG